MKMSTPDFSNNKYKLTFLGQAGFLISARGTRFLIDPYLSDYVTASGIGDSRLFSREFPAPVSPDALTGIDAVFITHAHADHCDPLTLGPILRNNPECRVICPREAEELLTSKGLSPNCLLVPDVGEDNRLGKLTFRCVPSAHYDLRRDAATGEYAYLGYLIQAGGVTLYHSGDTILYDGLIEALKQAVPNIDIACLPVNGRDTARELIGIVGNLMHGEALELAHALGVDLMIPMHNDLFKINQVNPAVVKEYSETNYPKQKIKWLQPGEEICYP